MTVLGTAANAKVVSKTTWLTLRHSVPFYLCPDDPWEENGEQAEWAVAAAAAQVGSEAANGGLFNQVLKMSTRSRGNYAEGVPLKIMIRRVDFSLFFLIMVKMVTRSISTSRRTKISKQSLTS